MLAPAVLGNRRFRRAEQPPPPAVFTAPAGGAVARGVLALRLVRTSAFGRRLQRPQVRLELQHGGGAVERRSTPRRERWGAGKAALRAGVADWHLHFSFAVDVPLAGGRTARRAPTRGLTVCCFPAACVPGLLCVTWGTSPCSERAFQQRYGVSTDFASLLRECAAHLATRQPGLLLEVQPRPSRTRA